MITDNFALMYTDVLIKIIDDLCSITGYIGRRNDG